MSNLTQQECPANFVVQPCDGVELIIQPKQKDLGEFKVRRALPHGERRMIGPWIFFDHMGPAEFDAGQGINVRPHPHINIATVTYLFEGEILHRDSLGFIQPIQPGAINLMVAGKGIAHSERETDAVRNSRHRLHGLQLWLALPDNKEEIDPAFYHYPAAIIPKTDVSGVAVRVLMGAAYGVISPVRTYSQTLYAEADLKAGQSLLLPDGVAERAVYVVSGALTARDRTLDQYDMAVFSETSKIKLVAVRDTRIALIGGEAFPKRHIWWNFVSSRKERIEQAKQDWQAGRFAKVTEDEEEFIPLP